jgi:hypothetical protein
VSGKESEWTSDECQERKIAEEIIKKKVTGQAVSERKGRQNRVRIKRERSGKRKTDK